MKEQKDFIDVREKGGYFVIYGNIFKKAGNFHLCRIMKQEIDKFPPSSFKKENKFILLLKYCHHRLSVQNELFSTCCICYYCANFYSFQTDSNSSSAT